MWNAGIAPYLLRIVGAALRPFLLVVALGLLIPGRAWAAEAEQWIERLQERIAECKDYQYLVTCYERQGKQEEQRGFTLFVKGSRLVRMKITDGRGKGSELAIDAQGRIRGRKGGLLKSFAQTLKPEDPRLHSLRGVAFWDATAQNFLAGLRERMAKPGSYCEIGPAGDPPGWLLLVVRRPGGASEQYWIDPEQRLLMKAEAYDAGQLVWRFVIRDVRVNVGLADRFFSF
jgi:hypothetical protein